MTSRAFDTRERPRSPTSALGSRSTSAEMQPRQTSDVTWAMSDGRPRQHSGLTALHALCRLSAQLEAADAGTRATLVDVAAPHLERLVAALCDGPRAPGFFGGAEPLLVSAMTIVGSDMVSEPEAAARLIETLAARVADPMVVLSPADVRAIERSLDDLARPTRHRFERALRERRSALTSGMTSRSAPGRVRAGGQP